MRVAIAQSMLEIMRGYYIRRHLGAYREKLNYSLRRKVTFFEIGLRIL